MPTLDDVLKVYRKKVIGWEEFENELKGVLERLIDTTQRFNYPASGFFKQTKIISDANDTFTLWYNTYEQNGTDGITEPGSVAKKFSSASATFNEEDVGKLIYIWGATDDDNNGVYKITGIIGTTPSTSVYVDHDFNSNETGLDWELNRPVGCNCRHDTNYRIVELMNEKFYDLNGYAVTKNPLTWRIPFKNATGVTYSIGIKRISIPYDLEVNARNGRPYYRSYRETIGEVGAPDSVSLVSGKPKLIIDALLGNTGGSPYEDHSGKKARVWLVDPQSRTRVEGMEEVTIVFSSNQNSIQCAGKLGQATASTTAADYVVAVESVTWHDKAKKDLSTDPDYAFTGEITGNGPTATPVGFSISAQVVFGSDVVDTLNINQIAKDLYSGGIGDLHGDGLAKFTNPFESWSKVQHYGPDDANYGKHEDITFETCYGQVTIAGLQMLLQAKDAGDNSAIKFVIRDNTPTDRIKLYPKGDIVADGDLTVGDGTDNLITLAGKLLGSANALFGSGILSLDEVGILEDQKLYMAGDAAGGLADANAFLRYVSATPELVISGGTLAKINITSTQGTTISGLPIDFNGVDVRRLDTAIQIGDSNVFETYSSSLIVMVDAVGSGSDVRARWWVYLRTDVNYLSYKFEQANDHTGITGTVKLFLDGTEVASHALTNDAKQGSTADDDWTKRTANNVSVSSIVTSNKWYALELKATTSVPGTGSAYARNLDVALHGLSLS